MGTHSRTSHCVVGLRMGPSLPAHWHEPRAVFVSLMGLLVAVALAGCSAASGSPTRIPIPGMPTPIMSGLNVIPGSGEPTMTEWPSESPSASPSGSPSATSTSGASDDNEGSCGGGLECGNLTPQPSTGMFVAASSLRKATSYKFSMTFVGAAAGSDSDFVNSLSEIAPGASCGNGTFTLKGTIANQHAGPTKGFESVFDADFTCPGLHIIEVGGSLYIDKGGTGTFAKTQLDDAYELDFFTPAHLVEQYVNPHLASHYTLVGSETKDGVSTDRYRSDKDLNEEVEGGQYDTWSADIWLAKSGGYPISMDVVAKESDGGQPYEIKFDITNVNDPGNKVTAPTR